MDWEGKEEMDWEGCGWRWHEEGEGTATRMRAPVRKQSSGAQSGLM